MGFGRCSQSRVARSNGHRDLGTISARSRRHLGAAPTQDRTRAPSCSARPKKERACRGTHEPTRAAVGANHADSSQVDSSQVGSRRRASCLGSWKVESVCVCASRCFVCASVRGFRLGLYRLPPFSFIAVWFHMAVRLGRSDPRPRAPFVRGDHGGDLGRNSPDTRDERPCGRGTCKLATISHRANLPTTMPTTEVHESRRLLFSSIRIQAETRRRRGATTHIS